MARFVDLDHETPRAVQGPATRLKDSALTLGYRLTDSSGNQKLNYQLVYRENRLSGMLLPEREDE